MLDAECRQVRVRHQVARRPALTQKAAEHTCMPRGGVDDDSRPRTDPFIDEIECSVGVKWARKQGSKRCQPNKREQDMPCETDRLITAEGLLDPALGAGVPRHAVVDGVQEHVCVDEDHGLLAEGELAQELLVLEHGSCFESAVVVDLGPETHRERALPKRRC